MGKDGEDKDAAPLPLDEVIDEDEKLSDAVIVCATADAAAAAVTTAE